MNPSHPGPNPFTKPRPLTDKELARLDELLLAVNPDESMLPEELDGFFTALLCGPQPVSSDEYLPEVFGVPVESARTTVSPEVLDELLRLLGRHWNAIGAELYDREGLSPLLGYDEAGRVLGNGWAVGFVRGMAMRADPWDALDDDEEMATALEPLMRVLRDSPPDPEEVAEPIPDDEREEVVQQMIDGVLDVYDWFTAERERNLAPAAPIRRDDAKVGRNDPCPCGSGRKYKLCHGQN
jgi:uncharacterized protein